MLHFRRNPKDGTSIFVGVVVRADHRAMVAGIVDAVDRGPAHALPAHVAERHRWAEVGAFGFGKAAELILGRHLADSVEIDDVVQAAGLYADIDDAALGE